MLERRRVSRPKTFKGALIVPEDERSAIRCIVRNLTEAGACLVVDPIGIPDTFGLALDSDGREWTCRIVWRKSDRMGVEFL
jgi:hypothetical protein